MNKKTIAIFLVITCLIFIMLMKLTLNRIASEKTMYNKSKVNTTVDINDSTINSKKLVKQIKYNPSRIIINANYKDKHKIMAKDIYSEKEIKKLVDFLNSIEYKEQIKNKSEIEEWDFLVRLYDTNNKTTQSITFYKNSESCAYRDDIAGVRITDDTYEKFLSLYKSLGSIEVHWSDIKK